MLPGNLVAFRFSDATHTGSKLSQSGIERGCEICMAGQRRLSFGTTGVCSAERNRSRTLLLVTIIALPTVVAAIQYEKPAVEVFRRNKNTVRAHRLPSSFGRPHPTEPSFKHNVSHFRPLLYIFLPCAVSRRWNGVKGMTPLLIPQPPAMSISEWRRQPLQQCHT